MKYSVYSVNSKTQKHSITVSNLCTKFHATDDLLHRIRSYQEVKEGSDAATRKIKRQFGRTDLIGGPKKIMQAKFNGPKDKNVWISIYSGMIYCNLDKKNTIKYFSMS